MRTPPLDPEWRHRTHCMASAAAAAFDGATMMPASASLRTCAERTCGSASVPVTEAMIAGALDGRAADDPHKLARRIGVNAPSQDHIEQDDAHVSVRQRLAQRPVAQRPARSSGAAARA